MAKTTVSIPLLYISHGDTRFGAGGCDVHVGGDMAKLPAIAVSCEGRAGLRERFITDELRAQNWLHERGLPLMVAWGLVNEVRNGVGNVPPPTVAPTGLTGKPLWEQLNVLSHRFPYDGPEARALTEAAAQLRKAAEGGKDG